MQLTNRQRACLEKLLDAHYCQQGPPIHYTTLARALGVANSTAYEMLRLLEQKGYVSSEYHLAEEQAGPGRSTVLFRPTLKTLRTFRYLLGEDARCQEWDVIREKLLHRLVTASPPHAEQLVADLLTAIPESCDPLSYCGHVLAASLLSIKDHLRHRVQEWSIFGKMERADASSFDALGLLPGFALGFACALQRNSSWLARLAECVERYQAYLLQMDEEGRTRLLRFSREMMEALRISSGGN
ncbi:MAG: helix-turn-helix domain-containing protein [Chloroflexi bacterium]|nr:helix-turn-helix domain-containing protein [Chloroflexota bacterium]